MHRRSFIHSAIAGAGAFGAAAPFHPEARVETANDSGSGSYIASEASVRLFYRDWHDRKRSPYGTARIALFLHSWALHSDIWQYQMNYLCGEGIRSVAYDRRGHGRSLYSGFDYDFDALATDLAEVLEALDLENVVLIGHSIGCCEIVRYLSKFGDSRVSRIVLVAPSLPFALKTHDNPSGTPKAEFLAAREAIVHDFPQFACTNARTFFGPKVSESQIDWAIRMCDSASIPALVGTQIANTETDFRQELGLIKKQTLILHGDSDGMAPFESTAERVQQLVQGSRLKLYREGPHGIMISHIDQLNRDLCEFISES